MILLILKASSRKSIANMFLYLKKLEEENILKYF
jgi:hypothetical protein